MATEMIVATETYQHHFDQWSGLLNIPSEFCVVARPVREDSVLAAEARETT